MQTTDQSGKVSDLISSHLTRKSAVFTINIQSSPFEMIFCEDQNILVEFSQNFTVENMENLESIKSITESNFKMCLIINIRSFDVKGVSQIFCRS